MKIFHYFAFLVLLLSFESKAQLCDSLGITQRTIRGSETEANIAWELSGNQVLFHPSCSAKGKLLLYLVGSYDGTNKTFKFGTLGAQMGYHVIILKYENSVAAQSACAGSSDINCYEDFRKEVIYGVDNSAEVTVDSVHSLVNRLARLLEHLEQNYAAEGWGYFLSGTDINWSKITVAGHSQGGGHAAYIAQQEEVDRAIFFASPNDYSNYYGAPANWVAQPFQTAGSRLYGFNNLQDDVVDFADQMAIWNILPFPNSDTVLVDGNSNPFELGQMLYTNYNANGSSSENHSAVIRDTETPLDGNGKPVYLKVWQYLLGDVNPTKVESNTSSAVKLYGSGNHIYLDPNGIALKSIRIINALGQSLLEKPSVEHLWVSPALKQGVYVVEYFEGTNYSTQKVLLNQP